MSLNQEEYLSTISDYFRSKDLRERLRKNPNDSSARISLSQLIYQNPFVFAGMPADKVDIHANEKYGGSSKRFVEKTKESLEEIVNDVTSKTKEDEEFIGLALNIGPYAKDPKYQDAVKLHKEIEIGNEALRTGNIDVIAKAMSEVYEDLKLSIAYSAVGPGRENLVEAYKGILQMKMREFANKFTTKVKKDDKEKVVVDRESLKGYILDSVKNVPEEKALDSYEHFGALYSEYNAPKEEEKKKE